MSVNSLLTNGKYMPYAKPNNTPLYIHSKSNHPPVIIKNLPESINNRLSDISSNEEAFNRSAPTYQKALEHSGYKHQLKFRPPPPQNVSTCKNKRRHRNVTWYNPPYSKDVATNIDRTFLKILEEEFPQNHALHKIFNRITVKVSYTCMSNTKQTIDGHKKAILKKDDPHHKTIDNGCDRQMPFPGKFITKSIVYQATVTTNDSKPDQTYAGLTSNTFKNRLAKHKTSFTNENKKQGTELSKHVWKLKDKNVDYKIKWEIIK